MIADQTELRNCLPGVFPIAIYYSLHSLSRILRGMEKNSRQPEFELKIRLWKPKIITGSQGMVKMNVKREGAKLKPSRIAKNKQITDT